MRSPSRSSAMYSFNTCATMRPVGRFEFDAAAVERLLGVSETRGRDVPLGDDAAAGRFADGLDDRIAALGLRRHDGATDVDRLTDAAEHRALRDHAHRYRVATTRDESARLVGGGAQVRARPAP